MIMEPWEKPQPGDIQQTNFNAYNQTDPRKKYSANGFEPGGIPTPTPRKPLPEKSD